MGSGVRSNPTKVVTFFFGVLVIVNKEYRRVTGSGSDRPLLDRQTLNG